MDNLETILPDTSKQKLEDEMKWTLSLYQVTRSILSEKEFLYGMVIDCLSSGHLLSKQTSESHKKMIQDMRNILSMSEIHNSLQLYSITENVNHKILDVNTELPIRKLRESITMDHLNLLTETLSSYIHNICNKVINFILPHEKYDDISEGMIAAVEKVKECEDLIKENKKKMIEKQTHNRILIRKISKEKVLCIELLDSLVQRHRYSDHALQHLHYLSVTMKAHLLKLQYLELDVLNRIYTPQAVAALKTIKFKLDCLIEKSNLESAVLKNQLDNYKDLGPEFENMVKEYTQIKKDLEFLNCVQEQSNNGCENLP